MDLKWAKDENTYVFKGDVGRLKKKFMKSGIFKEIQISTSMRYYLTQDIMVAISRSSYC